MGKRNTGSFPYAELFLIITILVYFIILAFITPQYSEKAALFPKFVLAAGFVLIVLKICSICFPKVKAVIEPEKKDIQTEGIPEDVNKSNDCGDETPISDVLIMIGWLILMSLLYLVIGIIPATMICTLVFFKFRAGQKWLNSFLLAFGLSLVLFVGFNILLSLKLYPGLLFD